MARSERRRAERPTGLCLLNDSKYGYDALDNELRLSILRSPIYAFHRPRENLPGVTYHYTDQGEPNVRYRCCLTPAHGKLPTPCAPAWRYTLR
jgi:hypothetical protein